jgi:CubicO group peptidase (beta-lactamase class C family)
MLKSPSTSVRVVLLMTMIAVLTSCGRHNPSQQTATSAIDQIIQPLIDDQWAGGVVVGTVSKEQAVILCYGRLSADNPQPPDANTVFEIGSLTKFFTALLLADMVERGEVSLEDPIGRFLPQGIRAPKRADGDIRLVDLATHTSGLPNIGANFWEDGDSIYDPDAAGRRWSGYSTDKLFECLSSVDSPQALTRVPGG